MTKTIKNSHKKPIFKKTNFNNQRRLFMNNDNQAVAVFKKLSSPTCTPQDIDSFVSSVPIENCEKTKILAKAHIKTIKEKSNIKRNNFVVMVAKLKVKISNSFVDKRFKRDKLPEIYNGNVSSEDTMPATQYRATRYKKKGLLKSL